MRSRMDGGDYSVADCSRMQWYNRRVHAYEAVTGYAWPGNKAWCAMRLSDLSGDGWTEKEIAGALDMPVRTIRARVESLKPNDGEARCPGCGVKMHPLTLDPDCPLAGPNGVLCFICCVREGNDER